MRKSRGFTIIELLIVISVILVLAAMLAPAVNKAKEKGRRLVCMNNVRELGHASVIYSQDFNETMPYTAAHTRQTDFQLLFDNKFLTTNECKLLGCPNSTVALPTCTGYRTLSANTIGYRYASAAANGLKTSNTAKMLIVEEDSASTNNTWDTADTHGQDGGNVFYVDGRAKWENVWANTVTPNLAVAPVTTLNP
jgi:prepilin-type N-terminal cleavage/methylation domain-containing protein